MRTVFAVPPSFDVMTRRLPVPSLMSEAVTPASALLMASRTSASVAALLSILMVTGVLSGFVVNAPPL
jgi:hypothetical protein